MDDNRIGTNDRACTNLDVWQNHATAADEGSFSDLDRRIIVLNSTSYFKRVMHIGKRMGYVDNRAVRCDGDVVTDMHMIMANDVDILFNVGVVSDHQAGDSLRARANDLEPNTVADSNTLANADKTWVEN